MHLYLNLSDIVSLIIATAWIAGLAWAGIVAFHSKITKRKNK